jgi:hypothetical protein
VDFNTALNIVLAELTPQPWDYTTADATTLRVIPAGLREDAGRAEILIRITRADATGLYSYGITGPDSRSVAEIGITTTVLPALIQALHDRQTWEGTSPTDDTLTVTPDATGVVVQVTEVHYADGGKREETVSTVLPEAQRLPLASALSRAMDVARGWEDE